VLVAPPEKHAVARRGGWCLAVALAGVLGSASKVGARSHVPGGILDVDARLSSPSGAPGAGAESSS
jgi:hypothetical protein